MGLLDQQGVAMNKWVLGRDKAAIMANPWTVGGLEIWTRHATETRN